MNHERNLELCQAGWDAFGKGDFDLLASYYIDDMVFVMPGQDDVLHGKAAFRGALDDIGQALPPGLEITGMRHCAGDNEVVTVFEWKSDKVPDGSQSAISFRFNAEGKITEERWFVDTVQWKAAF